MKKLWIPTLLVLLGACGFGQFFHFESEEQSRVVASMAHESLMSDSLTFSAEMDEKLISLHTYYLIGQKNLQALDSGNHQQLLDSPHYLNLLAVKSQVEEIEDEIKLIYRAITKSKKKKDINRAWMVRAKILEFADKSQLRHLSMENLSQKLNLKLHDNNYSNLIAMKELQAEYESLESINPKEFQVSEQNIEHLSHLMDVKVSSLSGRFFPSETEKGNITGYEFPSKVWALTFDDGPAPKTSSEILGHLKEKNLKATFFQLNEQVLSNKDIARDIKNAGMDMASHSWTHKQLTKEGDLALEKEISEAAKELKNFHKVELKFFRLPYGAGVSNTRIRQKIADNNLIHVFWSVDTLDWMPQPYEKIVERTKNQMKKSKKDAGIILFHDIHERTVKASAEIMDYLNQDSRRVCTLNTIVTQMNEGAETVCPK